MKILMTGATGFVGKALAKALHEKGYEISVLSRNPERAKEKLPFLKTVFQWNWQSENPPLAAFQNCDAVINLAGENIAAKRWTENQRRKIFNSRIHSTHQLIQAIELSPQKPKVFISTSAIGFYGNRGEEILTELSPVGTRFLPNLVYWWEEEALKTKNHGVRTIILRLGLVLDAHGGALQKILPVFQYGLGGVLGNGHQWMSWIHLEDLINLFKFALETKTVEGIFNAVSPQPVTNQDFTRTIGKILEKPTFCKVPAFLLNLFLGEMAEELLLTSQKVSSQKIISKGFQFKFKELDQALRNIIQK